MNVNESTPNAVRFTAQERELVFGVAMKFMKDEERAEDVAQDALLSAFRHRDAFRGDARFTTWLYRIAATTSLMHLRKQRSAERTQSLEATDPSEGHELVAPGATPEERCAATEAAQFAAARLAALGEKYGAIFALRFVDGYSESEIASRLQLNVSTVKTRAYRARASLKRALEGVLERDDLPIAA